MKLDKEKDHPLLGRKRYTYMYEHAGQATPKKTAIKEELSKKLGVGQEKISIRNVLTQYGVNTSKVIVHIYEDEKLMAFLEPPKGKKAAPAKK
ncbi:MAG: hypothetical protein WC595_05190 [Candidatus Nanoarchaeia archaeon]